MSDDGNEESAGVSHVTHENDMSTQDKNKDSNGRKQNCAKCCRTCVTSYFIPSLLLFVAVMVAIEGTPFL